MRGNNLEFTKKILDDCKQNKQNEMRKKKLEFAKKILDDCKQNKQNEIYLAVSSMSDKLKVSRHTIKKWINDFIVDGLIDSTRTIRNKAVKIDDVWINKRYYYTININVLKHFVDASLGLNGELLKLYDFFCIHVSNFTTSDRRNFEAELRWSEKKFKRKVEELINYGIVTSFKSERIHGRYTYALIDYARLDSGINWLIDIVKNTDGDFRMIHKSDLTQRGLNYLVENLKLLPTYRYDELRLIFEHYFLLDDWSGFDFSWMFASFSLELYKRFAKD